MKDRVAISIVLNSKYVNEKIITSLLDEELFFEPTKMGGSNFTKNKLRRYNSARFLEYFRQEKYSDDRITINLEDEVQNSFSLIKGAWIPDITWISLRLNGDIYDKHREIIMNYVDNLMKDLNGIVARVLSLKDNFWQENTDINMYRSKGKPLDGVHTKPSPFFENKMIVDTEYNPGHSHVINGIWFGSCWGMWFGDDYFRYIPKIILKDFKQCYSNVELEGGVIRILLFKDLWDYDLQENRERQFNFRKSVGIDEVAHDLEKNKTHQKVLDPSIELESGIFAHGGVKRVIYYYDCEGEIVPKSKASGKKIFEFDNEGNIVWSNY